jgi:excisionase family DNA binding protein
MLSVSDAARALGVNPGRVRQLAVAGQLEAEKVGGRWLVPEAAVAARQAVERPAGRPLSPRAAWGLLEAAADRSASWLAPSEQRRARVRASGWSLAHWAWACQRRAEVHRLYVHPSLVDRLALDARVVRSGASARAVAVDVLAVGVVEGYVHVEAFDALVGEYALAGAGRINVVLRVPPAELFVFGDEDEAAWPVVAVDLYDAGDDRSRRAAQSLLNRHRR